METAAPVSKEEAKEFQARLERRGVVGRGRQAARCTVHCRARPGVHLKGAAFYEAREVAALAVAVRQDSPHLPGSGGCVGWVPGSRGRRDVGSLADEAARRRRVKQGGNKKVCYTEGWVEFEDKRVAKRVAKSLNNTKIGGSTLVRLCAPGAERDAQVARSAASTTMTCGCSSTSNRSSGITSRRSWVRGVAEGGGGSTSPLRCIPLLASVRTAHPGAEAAARICAQASREGAAYLESVEKAKKIEHAKVRTWQARAVGRGRVRATRTSPPPFYWPGCQEAGAAGGCG